MLLSSIFIINFIFQCLCQLLTLHFSSFGFQYALVFYCKNHAGKVIFTSVLSRYLCCWLYVLISLLSTLCSFVVEFMLQGLYVLVSLLCCLCVLMYLSLKSCSSTFHMLNLCSRIIDVVSSALIFSFMFFSFIIGFTFWFLYCLFYGLVSLH